MKSGKKRVTVNREPVFLTVKTERAFEKVAQQIKESIFSSVYTLGDRLPSERELASQFGVARIVIREALRVLENSGFIFIKKGSEGGAFVKEMGSAMVTQSIADMVRLGKIDFEHLTECRLPVEKMVVGFAVERADADDLELLRTNIEQSEKVLSTEARATETNVGFHVLLGKASKNPLFELLEECISSVVFTLLQVLPTDLAYSRRVLEYHKEIYKAIESRDRILGEKLMEAHIRDVSDNFLQSSQSKERRAGRRKKRLMKD